MSYGIEITSASGGKLLINEDYSAYHYIGDASLVTGRQWRITTGYAGRSVIPFVVTSTGTYATVEAIVEIGSGTWDIYIKAGNQANITRVLCFSTLPSMGPAEGYGVMVLRADGATAFDSTRKPLYLRGVHDLTAYANSGSITSMTVPSLTTPAVFCACSGAYRVFTYGHTEDTYSEQVLAARVNGTSLEYQYLATYFTATSHTYVADLLAPDIYEDFIVNALVTVIDASIY